jgi:hypothetical protein
MFMIVRRYGGDDAMLVEVDMDRNPGLVADIEIGAGRSFSFELNEDEEEEEEETEGAMIKGLVFDFDLDMAQF